MARSHSLLVLLALAPLAACVTQPTGPSVAVMPAPYKPFEIFQQEDAVCRAYAAGEVAGGADKANERAVASAAIGAGLGTALGAAAGDGRGAAVGAATGATIGTAAASGPAARAEYSLQRRYDIAYQQCMYAKGNQVPGYPMVTPPPPPPVPVR